MNTARGTATICLLSALLLGTFELLSQAQSTSTIAGVVSEAGSNRPLSGVVINMMQGSSIVAATTTDAVGGFKIEIPAGSYRLEPILAQFVHSRPDRVATLREPGEWAHLSAGQQVDNFHLYMERAATITGRVFDTQGNPISRATVYPFEFRFDGTGRRGLAAIPGATRAETDDRGEFRLFGLRRGNYFLEVIGNQQEVFYPGTPEESKAVSVHLDAGAEAHLGTIVLPPRNAVLVRFHFLDESGRLPSIRAVFIQAGQIASADTMERDQFSVRLNPGHYEGVLSWFMGREILFGPINFDLGSSGLDQDVVMRRGYQVTGTLLTEDGPDPFSPAKGIRCDLKSNDPTPKSFGPLLGCIGGQFGPGFYTLEVSNMPQDAYIISATAGDRDLLKNGIEIDRDIELNIRIGAQGGQVSGSILDTNGDRLSDVVVALVPDSPLRTAQQLYRSAVSDLNGNFELRGVRPGSYHLFAWSEIEDGAYRNAEFMKDYEDRGTAVEVRKSDHVSVTLTAF